MSASRQGRHGGKLFDNKAAVRVAMKTYVAGEPAATRFHKRSLHEPERSEDRYFPGRLAAAGAVAPSLDSGPGGAQAAGGRGANAAKLLRACGGCLGARRRRRARKTAISPGEPSNGR